jgi:hypothetical protein
MGYELKKIECSKYQIQQNNNHKPPPSSLPLRGVPITIGRKGAEKKPEKMRVFSGHN